jgi:septum formation protein
MGLTFLTVPSTGEEIITKQQPYEVVMELATQKAKEVAAGCEGDCLIIGADTVVVKDAQILGKPKDEADAMSMLRRLQDATHQVYTGVCLIQKSAKGESCHSFYEATDVAFYPMTEEEIRSYVDAKEPENKAECRDGAAIYVWQDKAGGYGIQDVRCAKFIRKIDGDYYNVVGLPVARLYHELLKIGCIAEK